MKKLVILTPTFNRVELLKRLYKSLQSQTKKKFTWLIIDDGSTDKTRKYVEEIQEKSYFEVKYIYQENSGKIAAINTGFDNSSETSMIAIVDSDDYLNKNAVSIFNQYVKKYEENEEIGGMFFHYLNSKTNNIIQPETGAIDSDVVTTKYEYDNQYGKHDGCVCYTRNVIDKYKYPVVEGEKYMGPTVLQMLMADEYKIVFSPEIVGVAEYQEGGLTDSGRRIRMESPKSMLIYTNLMMDKKNTLLVRLKYAISTWPYLLSIEESKFDFVKKSNSSFLLLVTFIPGLLLYNLWKQEK